MEMRFKHAIGATLWRINAESRAESFTARVILVEEDTVCYGESRYYVTEESMCFPTKEALLAYVSGDSDDNQIGKEA